MYGQVTKRPNDDPPYLPSNSPESPPEDKGTSDNASSPVSDRSSQGSGTYASGGKDFRQVEGSPDEHMKWIPPASYKTPGSASASHFTAATSPTRVRDFQ